MLARERIHVIGAGPVGSLLSLLLAKRGFEVDAYERRPDMRRETVSAGRSINLAVSTRGIHALGSVGMADAVLAEAVPMNGRMMHSVSGELTYQPYGKEDSDCIYSISRGGLNQALMTAAEKTGKVRLHFRHRALGLEPGGVIRIAKDHPKGGFDDAFSLEPSVVFATDGSASAVRADLIRRTNGEASSVLLDYGYKELHLPAGADGKHQLEKNALHIWPRGAYMAIALPNFDGSFTCTLFLPFKADGAPSFETLRTREQVEQFFKAQFPDLTALLPALQNEFFENPTGQMVTIKCAPWNLEGECLLLGDAAHAIVPFFGQGMNCGFEDCSVLDEMLEKALATSGAALDWATLFKSFSRARKDNADAIADMAAENFIEMRDKVGDPRFLLEKQVERVLQREFPKDYFSRYALVTFSRVPYRRAWEAGEIHQGILSELCRNLSSVDQLDLSRAATLIHQRLGVHHKNS